jgi:signal transduction histidine kinase
MNKLEVRFGLALCIVLFATTLLPFLILYLLSVSGLVEMTYVAEGRDVREAGLPIEPPVAAPPENPNPLRLLWEVENPGVDLPLGFPRIDPVTRERIPGVFYNQATGQWISGIPSDLQRVAFTSPVFKFRVDLPARFVLGSLPLIGLLFGLFLSISMSRSVTRPITKLAEATRAIGQRELGYRVPLKGSQELQELAQSFNHMAEELEQGEITRRNLTADVAHELRTPLAVLEGNLRAMLDGVHAMNEEEIALLYEQTHHLNRLVNDLRELSLVEANQLALDCREVDLVHLIRETVAHFDLLAHERGIQLTIELEEPLIHPCLDEKRMRQILHNLLSNAFSHTPSGGKVTISGKQSADDRAVEVAVIDTGAGISKYDLPYIFDRFFRAKEAASRDHGGSGLGLAIVKALVEAQGGQIQAKSAGLNQGSTFTLILYFDKDGGLRARR